MLYLLRPLLTTLLTSLSLAAAAQPAPELSAAMAQRDLRILQRALTDLHPGLYRYATPAQFEAEFARAQTEVAAGSDRGRLYLIASRVAALARCGHTWANPYNQSDAVVQGVINRADKLPLTLRRVEGRFLVTASAVPEVLAGSEIVAIDGRSAADIAAGLMPYLRADGASDGKRLAQLDSDPNGGAMDRVFPLLYPPQQGRYRLTLRDPGGPAAREVSVAATSVTERAARVPAPRSDAWRFTVDGDTATLTLPTFSFWNGGFDGKAFLARSFEQLEAQTVPYLVIDLRDNEGGDDALGHQLLRHLLREPFTMPGGRRESAYERVPYILARYLDTWDFSFFDRTGQVTRGAGRNWLLTDSDARRLDPVAQPYRGRTIALVGPQNSSAGFLIARDLHRSGVATLVGQPTGGNLRGLNGGQLAWITLPGSGVAIDVPLLAHFAPGDEPDAGVMPHILAVPRWADAQAGIDTERRAAEAQIARWRHN